MKRKSYYMTISLISIFIIFISCKKGVPEATLYGKLSPRIYVAGQFNPKKNNQFVCINDYKIPTNKRKHYLRREAAVALKKMYKAFKKDHPDVPFYVVSSTRNFFDQKWIWENKWKNVKKYSKIKNPLKRAKAILTYSSMPGTSRHHWGSDFDLNKLYNSYFDKGNGKILFNWLKKNAKRFGFGQPYTAGRSAGYNEERWHWSYLPLARYFLKDWNKFYKESKYFTQKGLFKGSHNAGHLAKIYVNAIDRSCK